MSARQRLQKRCDALRHRKMANIATLLELPALASPSSYYSITSLDGGNAVWSPSSRGYSSSRHQSGQSSPVNSSPQSAPVTPAASAKTLATPSATKSRLLSPKMEQILQKQQKTPSRNTAATRLTNTPSNNQTRSQAVELASLLQTTPPLGPVEITGHAANSLREGSSSMEIGEELVEESSVTFADSSSSFVLLNTLVEVDRESNTQTSSLTSTKNDLSKQNSAETPSVRSSASSLSTVDESHHQRLQLLNIVKNALTEKSQSAPGSPRGRKKVQHFPTEIDELSKSLPTMSLRSEAEGRKQRAQRARQKAKSAAKLRGNKN